MKQGTNRPRRISIAAAISAIAVLAGGTVGIFALRPSANAETISKEETNISSKSKSDDKTISAGGTITSSQLSDSLGLKNTAVQLKVGEVLAESGDTVTAGTPLYQITSDSLEKAEKTLRSELQTAKSSLLEQEISYQTDKNEAYLLYESELDLGTTAQTEYENSLKSLDSSLQKAYDSYQEALDTINNTPSEISQKQSEMNYQQARADELQNNKNNIQQEANEAKSAYTSAAENYNSLTAEYNAAAGVVRYIGNALGRDTSGITLKQTVSSSSKEQNESAGDKNPASFDGNRPDTISEEIPQGMQIFSGNRLAEVRENEPSDEDIPDTFGISDIPGQETNKESESLAILYDSAYGEYISLKEQLSQAENEMKNAENHYKELSASLTECSNSLKEAQNNVTSLSKEISNLESTLSKAKSNLSKLRSEYNSLKSSYETDKLEIKKEFDTDTASYENAEYHYQITCSTLEDELAEAQEAYDTAEENLKIFEENLSDGYICASQDGTIYSLNCQEGRSVNTNMPFVYYVDESEFCTTVELDQNDITQVNIGDTVVIYSSETGMANGKITAIAAGESTSLADVRFNVTVTADENANLYVGQSVNVYFNYNNMKSSDFSDFKGEMNTDGEKRSFDGERPDFSGGMPEGFSPSGMPDFSRGKDN